MPSAARSWPRSSRSVSPTSWWPRTAPRAWTCSCATARPWSSPTSSCPDWTASRWPAPSGRKAPTPASSCSPAGTIPGTCSRRSRPGSPTMCSSPWSPSGSSPPSPSSSGSARWRRNCGAPRSGWRPCWRASATPSSPWTARAASATSTTGPRSTSISPAGACRANPSWTSSRSTCLTGRSSRRPWPATGSAPSSTTPPGPGAGTRRASSLSAAASRST